MRKLSAVMGYIALLNLSANAQPLVNLGLVGVGRIPADSFDALGTGIDTIGGVFSGMALDLRNNQTNLYALPDRGFGDGTNDYHNRSHAFGLNVQPYYAPFPVSAQNQIKVT